MEHENTEANKTLFSAWVTDPAKVGQADAEQIETMAARYPSCQILRALRAKAVQSQPQRVLNPILARASLHTPDRRVLFNLFNHPNKLKPLAPASLRQTETYYQVVEEDDYSAELIAQLPEEEHEPELSETNFVEAKSTAAGKVEEFPKEDDDTVITIVLEEDESASSDTSQHEEEEQEVEFSETNFVTDQAPDSFISDQPQAESESLEKEPEETAGVPEPEIGVSPSWTEEEKIIFENIAAADFFAFEERLDQIHGEQNKEAEPAKEDVEDVETRSVIDPEEVADLADPSESNEMARYDDDTMPYSFLWWLHKTRKEHADTYQPYVEFRLDTNRKIKKAQGQELNQQIIENIFHLQSPLDDLEATTPQTVHFEVKRKEEEIIEKFIREEPQIHPPSPDKLDMENKARRSAEDPNDLVSETLASIYTEQMLFHKAIDTYQKLSLKYPEKRAYFADQISELQKKIN